WFRYAKLDGTKFPNLTKITGQSVFYAMMEGTRNLEFPELTQISGVNVFSQNNGGVVTGLSGNSATITLFKFPKLESISGNNVFRDSKLEGIQFLKLDSISGSYVFYSSKLEGIQFPKLKNIKGTNNFSNSIIIDEKLEFPVIEEIHTNNFQNIPTLLSISMPSVVPKVGSGSFTNGNSNKVLITPSKEDHSGYILDNQDGKSGDHLWFGFKTHDAVFFDSNEGSTINPEIVDFITKKVNKPADPVKNNSTFLGWFYEDGTEFKFDDLGSSVDTIDNILTVYAKWSQNYYNLKYDSNSGVGSMPDVIVNQGDTVAVLNSSFTKEGYTLKNWNTNADGSGVSYEVGELLDPSTASRILVGE
ncbi:MAG: InlB B-repeat-containing protein, partial [Mycoplasmatales bacterium]